MTTGYMTGFGGYFETEAVDGALPKGRNSPQRPAFGLYTEQLSGSSFTSPRHENRRSWLYRMRPTADHRPFTRYGGAPLFGTPGMVVSSQFQICTLLSRFCCKELKLRCEGASRGESHQIRQQS